MSRCPLCADPAEKKALCKVNLIYNTQFDLAECNGCGVVYFDPMPSSAQLAAFYSASYYDFDRGREEGKGMAFAQRLKRWKTNGRFIDVGCATGFFLNGIKNNSQWEVYGTDFGESAVRYAHDVLHLNVVQGDLADARFPDAYFDYVHVNNVLEHVLDPLSLLKECRRIIKPDGVFFLSVPNGYNDSLDLIEFARLEHKPARSKNGHIFFFPARTLLKLFDQFNFIVEKRKTYSLKRGMRSSGLLPRKRDWKTDYFPHKTPKAQTSSDVHIPEQKKRHSDLYYRYRFIQGNLQMIPGLHDFGLDFLFILRPRGR
ncbi:MAG TPA: class I SAM-dependent methyltransferase [Bacteroidota bacterium]|nr:class I SAM-dependent methyltransferase [Bacteroidota bacterium]